MGFARGLYALTQAILLILLARGVGPQGFGVVASYLAGHTFLFLLAGMNTPTFVTREMALGHVDVAVKSIRINSRVMAVAFALACASSLFLVNRLDLLIAV